MQVLHNDAGSIHLAGDGFRASLTGQDDGLSPELELVQRTKGQEDTVLYSGSLFDAHRVPHSHKHAVLIGQFLARYVDSGQIDAYRAAHK